MPQLNDPIRRGRHNSQFLHQPFKLRMLDLSFGAFPPFVAVSNDCFWLQVNKPNLSGLNLQ